MIIGIIGTGFGKTIAQTFRAVDKNCGIFLCGSNKDKTKKIAAEIGVQVIEKWQDLILRPEIDLAVIATPSSLHKKMFEAIIKQNKHILLEKPAATTAQDIRDMIALSKNYSKNIIVNHEVRFNPVVSYIKNCIENNLLGDIMTLRIGAYLNLFSNESYTGTWYNRKESGGGQLLAIGVHQIDLARFLLNMPKIEKGAIFTSVYDDPRFTESTNAESQFSGNLITEKGTCVELFNDSYCFGGKDFIIEVIGSRGIIKYSDTQGLRVSFANDQPLEEIQLEDSMPDIKIGNSILTKSLKFFVKELIEMIEKNKANDRFCSLQVAADNLEIIEKYKD